MISKLIALLRKTKTRVMFHQTVAWTKKWSRRTPRKAHQRTKHTQTDSSVHASWGLQKASSVINVLRVHHLFRAIIMHPSR